jgi:hypothetical protein
MQVEFSKDLESLLAQYEHELQIQGTFIEEEAIMERYLNRGYGNAYDFNQIDRQEERLVGSI